MDSFEINKIVASILLIALLFIGIGKISNLFFMLISQKLQDTKLNYLKMVLLNQISDKKSETVEEVDIASLLALGDISHGEKVFKKCSACHVVEKGEQIKLVQLFMEF